MNLSAVILAGGRSLRMGRDKAWLELGGQPLIARAVALVRGLGVNEIFISGRAGDDYSALRCPVLLDLKPGFGPLGGIERALEAADSPLLLVLPVDLPRMTVRFLGKLMTRCDRQTGAVAELNGRLEPLVAVYPKRCHTIARDFISHSRHKARDFAGSCRQESAVRILSVAPADAGCFANWNTPSDISDPAGGVWIAHWDRELAATGRARTPCGIC